MRTFHIRGHPEGGRITSSFSGYPEPLIWSEALNCARHLLLIFFSFTRPYCLASVAMGKYGRSLGPYIGLQNGLLHMHDTRSVESRCFPLCHTLRYGIIWSYCGYRNCIAQVKSQAHIGILGSEVRLYVHCARVSSMSKLSHVSSFSSAWKLTRLLALVYIKFQQHDSINT